MKTFKHLEKTIGDENEKFHRNKKNILPDSTN